MRDELFDRDYQAGRDALNDGIDRLVKSFAEAWTRLQSIQFDAPWKHTKPDRRADSRGVRTGN